MPILGKGQFFLVGCELADGISQIAAIGDGVATMLRMRRQSL
jgi:hypothetical protein